VGGKEGKFGKHGVFEGNGSGILITRAEISTCNRTFLLLFSFPSRPMISGILGLQDMYIVTVKADLRFNQLPILQACNRDSLSFVRREPVQ
jgi:hypothetical protein